MSGTMCKCKEVDWLGGRDIRTSAWARIKNLGMLKPA